MRTKRVEVILKEGNKYVFNGVVFCNHYWSTEDTHFLRITNTDHFQYLIPFYKIKSYKIIESYKAEKED